MPAVLAAPEKSVEDVLPFPPRDLLPVAAAGCCCIIVAAVFAGILYAVAVWIPPGGPPEWDVFIVPIIVAAIGVALILIHLLGSATAFEIVGGDLCITESFGPIRWTKVSRLAGIKQLTIRHLLLTIRKDIAPPPKDEDSAVLVIDCWDQAPVQCAYGYCRKQLVEIASKISRLCANVQSPNVEAENLIPVIEEDEATLFEERLEQPENSRVKCEYHADGVTLHVPPARFGGGLILLSPGVVGVFLHFAIVFVMALPNPNFFDVVSMVASTIFGAGYIWLMLAKTRCQAVFAVVGDQLLLMRTGVLRSKRNEWDRKDLYDIRSGDADPDKVKKTEFDLQLWKRDGKKEALLRSEEEANLRWMATVLRRAMRLPLKREELVEHTPDAASAVVV